MNAVSWNLYYNEQHGQYNNSNSYICHESIKWSIAMWNGGSRIYFSWWDRSGLSKEMTSRLKLKGQEINSHWEKGGKNNPRGENGVSQGPKVQRYNEWTEEARMTRSQCVRKRGTWNEVRVHPFFFNILGKWHHCERKHYKSNSSHIQACFTSLLSFTAKEIFTIWGKKWDQIKDQTWALKACWFLTPPRPNQRSSFFAWIS